MSSKAEMQKMGWTGWGKDVDGVGFSFNDGDLKGDMEPRIGADKMIRWVAVFWRGEDRAEIVAEVWGECHLTCARESALVLSGS